MLVVPTSGYSVGMRDTRPPRRTPEHLAERPTWLLNRAAARASALLASGFAEHGDGLRGYHYRILASLEEWGEVTQADLGRDTGIDRSDVTAAVTELEARGLVSRAIDPSNRRRKIVSITPAGAATRRELEKVLDDIQRTLLAPLTATQRAQFFAIMPLIAADPVIA